MNVVGKRGTLRIETPSKSWYEETGVKRVKAPTAKNYLRRKVENLMSAMKMPMLFVRIKKIKQRAKNRRTKSNK